MALIDDVSDVVDGALETAITATLDLIISDSYARVAAAVTMLGANRLASLKAEGQATALSKSEAGLYLYSIVSGAHIDIPLVRSYQKLLVMPNIGGIPICSDKVVSSREVEISENAVIVQSENHRQYWTDNAVPRLREWQLTGYLTDILHLDDKWLFKPTLNYQAYFLDVCAKSRRPVLFKTNRGEFVLVQIQNIQTTDEASVMNAIGISIHVKEYNPYKVNRVPAVNVVASLKGAVNGNAI